MRPDLALAHWLAATVFVARGTFDFALNHVRAGCAGQDRGHAGSGNGNGNRDDDGNKGRQVLPFSAVGLHLLHGLILAATGDAHGARRALERELAFDGTEHICANESVANAHYAIGALDIREQQTLAAREHFKLALAKVRGHALATIAVNGAKAGELPKNVEPGSFNQALGTAVALAMRSRHDEAARLCGKALEGEAGANEWIISVEPLLDVSAHPAAWERTLALLRDRWS